MIQIKQFIVNPIQENCYILSDESKEAVIIDCGALFERDRNAIADYIATESLKPVAHLLTHAHFDHLFGARFLADAYGLLPRFAAADAAIYAASERQAAAMFGQVISFDPPAAGTPVADGDIISFGTHTITVIATPGHSPGGVCYYCADEGIIFSGDTLFRMSIGRTDLPGGDYRTLITSLTDLAAQLPDNVRVYPGHGPATTIADERHANPYIV